MDETTRGILAVLGDGGTVDMAERVRRWVDAGNGGIHPRHILGFAEITARLKLTPAQARAIIENPAEAFPSPVTNLKATPIWDGQQVEVWATGHDIDTP